MSFSGNVLLLLAWLRPIAQVQDAGLEGGGVDELERLVVALVLEEADAAAQGHGVDEELELIEEVVAEQRTHRRGAAADGDAPSGLLLERGELLGDVAPDQGRVLPVERARVVEATSLGMLLIRSASDTSLPRFGQGAANTSYVVLPSNRMSPSRSASRRPLASPRCNSSGATVRAIRPRRQARRRAARGASSASPCRCWLGVRRDGSAVEEVRHRRGERRRVDVVGLALQGAALRVGEGGGDRLGRRGQPRGLPAVNHQGGGLDGGEPPGR